MMPLAAVSVIKLLVDVVLLVVVNTHAPESYMDEPFHVVQTQQYCAGRYDVWDPKITTLPGLYVVGTAWAKLLEMLGPLSGNSKSSGELGMGEACGTTSLRAVNMLLAAACLPLLHAVIRHSWSQQPFDTQSSSVSATAAATAASMAPAWLWALVLATMPLHWFYTFLYYTDVGSSLLLLACYHLAVHQHTALPAGLVGAAAVMFRQTNAVWVAFALGATIVTRTAGSFSVPSSSNYRGQASKQTTALKQRTRKQHLSIWQETAHTLRGAWAQKWPLLAQLWPLLGVVAGFVVFLAWNGGVTVGDRSAHAPVKHPAQLVYFLLFAVVMLWPMVVGEAWALLCRPGRVRRLAGTAIAAVVATATCVAALKASPEPHPYLIADNRHYTFYVWRRLLGRSPLVRQWVVAPTAGVSAVLLARLLLRTRSQLWVLGYVVCLAAVLVPAWLIEFRYYSAGLLLLALHLPRPSRLQAGLTLMTYVVINTAALHMFLTRTWAWYDGSVARFMW